MLTQLWRGHDLVLAFVRRDLAVRYRSSLLGWGWSLLEPITTVLFFSVVFLAIFRVEAPPMGNGSGSFYALFLFCGLVAWNLFASQQTLSIDTLRSCAPLMGKVPFPVWTAIVGAQIVQLVQVLVEFVVLCAVLLLFGNVSWTWVLAVPIIVGLSLFAMGVGLMVGVSSGYIGDVRQIVLVTLSIVFFATPVLYPLEMLEGQRHAIELVVLANPLSWYVQAMHDVMYSLTAPSGWVIVALVAFGAAVFWLGFHVCDRLAGGLADRL